MPILEFQQVSFQNDGRTILEPFSVSIEQGEFVSIVGPSGSGKSTFLKLCSHLISPTSGDIRFHDNSVLDINPIDWRQRIAYCFQAPHLFGDTVLDNLIYPYEIRKVPVDRDYITSRFRRFHMDESYLDRPVSTLSGGEKQRIALIRSLLFQPEILLLDEATSALDEENTDIVEKVIQDLHQEGMTILWVTHNPAQSKRYATRLLTFENARLVSDVPNTPAQ